MTTLTDLNGKTTWSKTFTKPFQTQVPLADMQGYTLSLAVEKDKLVKDMLILGPDLVNKGIEKISLDVSAKEASFHVQASTKKQANVPLQISFHNEQGKELWSEKLIAPFDKTFSPKTSEPGAYFQFSSDAASALVSFYPNPASGQLFVDNRSTEELSMTLSDLSSQLLLKQDKLTKGINGVSLSKIGPGLYVICFSGAKELRKELLQVK